jgi:cytochrome b561
VVIQALRYGAVAIVLHWVLALAIPCAIAVGIYMHDLPLSPHKLKVYSWHKWIGVTIFLLAVFRVLWRATHPAPPLPAAIPPWQRNAAQATHLLLYVLILVIPLSGWLMSSAYGVQVVYFGLLPLPDLLAKDKALADQLKELHQGLNITMALLLVAHVGAALKHHFVDRDDVLRRMLPGSRKS